MNIWKIGGSTIDFKGGWNNLWEEKGCPISKTDDDEDDEYEQDDSFGGGFNGVELQLTLDDIEYLEEAIKNQELRDIGIFLRK